jgi:hypothetical protein
MAKAAIGKRKLDDVGRIALIHPRRDLPLADGSWLP